MRKIENAYEEKISELFHQYEALSDSGLLYKFVFAGEMDEEEAERRLRLWKKAVDRTRDWIDEDVEALQER